MVLNGECLPFLMFAIVSRTVLWDKTQWLIQNNCIVSTSDLGMVSFMIARKSFGSSAVVTSGMGGPTLGQG